MIADANQQPRQMLFIILSTLTSSGSGFSGAAKSARLI
jgi:hypothetical protein